jgi:hypothetical protein
MPLEADHGEAVKEYHFPLDGPLTHAYRRLE